MDATSENDYKDNENVLMNVTLAKFLYLNQILDPKSLKYRGYNVYNIVVFLVMVLYELPISIMFFMQSVYYMASDVNAAILNFAAGMSITFACYKVICVIYYSEEIWHCLNITRFSFTSYGRYNRTIFETWRTISVRVTYGFLVVFTSCLICCLYSPILFERTFVSVKDRDGSISRYHLNVVNMYFFSSAETYNTHFNVFYAIEVVYLTINCYITTCVDMLMISLCLALTCRFQMVSDAFTSIEQNYFDAYSNDDTNSNVLPKNELNTLLYNDLITILKDHQKIMANFESFLTIFRLAMLIQIVASAFGFVIVCFILTLNFVDGRTVDMGTTIKMIFSIPMFLFQLFAASYLFELINTQKDSIVFALYSSNWTEMDMKCKKLILLAMYMNNANQIKLKFSNLNVVNLELFYKTMRISYSMFSMLINTVKQDVNT